MKHFTASLLAFSCVLAAALSCSDDKLLDTSSSADVEVLAAVSSPFTTLSMAEDDEGFIWLGTMDHGLLRFDGTQYLHFFASGSATSLSADRVNDVFEDSKGRLWVATQKGFDLYDGNLGFIHVSCDDSNLYGLQVAQNHAGDVYALTRRSVLVYNESTGAFAKKMLHRSLSRTEPEMIFDRSDNIWIRYDNSLRCYDRNYTEVAAFEFSSDIKFAYDGMNTIFVKDGSALRCIDVSQKAIVNHPWAMAAVVKSRISTVVNISEDIILFKTDGGSYVYDCQSSTLYDDSTADASYRMLLLKAGSEPFVYDESETLWLPDGDSGVKSYSSDLEGGRDQLVIGDFFKSHINATYAMGGNYNWYLSSDGILMTYDKANSRISGYSYLMFVLGNPVILPVMSYCEDGHLLISDVIRTNSKTYLLGIGENGVPYLECTYESDAGVLATFGPDGSIWAAGSGSSLFHADRPSKGEKTKKFEPVMNPQKDVLSYASEIMTLSDGRLLVCYTDNPPVIVDPATSGITVLKPKFALLQAYYLCSLEDNAGNIWVGSTDNGLFVQRVGKEVLDHVDFFGNRSITGIEQDVTGTVYVLTNSCMLYKYVGGDDFRLVWSDAREVPGRSVLVKMPDGRVALNTQEGLVSFGEEESSLTNLELSLVAASGKKPVAVFTSKDMVGDKYKVKIKSADDNFNLRISPSWHGHRSFSYDYNYSVNKNNGAMVHSMNNPVIPLYGLKYGRNVVRFKVVNANTKAESEVYRLIVNVKYPLAMKLAALVALLMFAAITILLVEHRKRKKEAENERRERLIQEQINKGNIDFFANISHEFRTPLTLINGAVSMLGKSSASPNADAERPIAIIQRNTARMLKLVGQMLDFNKLDHDMLRLNVAMEDVTAVIRHVKETFELGANVKNIDLELHGCDIPFLGYIDSDKIDKILSNLLSNAFKYTSPGGRIVIDVKSGERLVVSVSDTGIGLQEDKIDTLFERFTRLDSASKTSGTGIGLCYTKGLVTLHHGTIKAANRYEADATGSQAVVGSVFTFELPLTAAAYTEEEMAVSEDTHKAVDDKAYSNEMVTFSDQNQNESSGAKPTMLVIDDDYEMVYYLRSLFSAQYNVNFRFDAMSGYNKIEEIRPDIIICDMMMLDVDGLQLCRMVKENLSMCHIPLVMLTAKSSVQDQIDSLNSGADAYVAKPFNPDYLMALAKSMVENRNRMKSLLTSSVAIPKETVNKLSPMDKEFMDKIYEMMESNIEDGQIDIDSMAEHMGVSRSKFFYKIKALTGQTPNDFFTTYKLNRAKELIEDGRYKISAIADMVGFSSGSYFANLFKKKFGVLPSQYREQYEQGQS